MKSVYVMAAIYVLAGLNHFRRPKLYARMIPGYLPAPRALVFWSGVAEVALGLLLANPDTRELGARGIIALLVAVFPANVQMVFTQKSLWPRIPRWVLWLRLPLQGVLIYWAYGYT